MALSAAYRKAQRQFSQWLEGGRTARRQVFAIRTTIAALDAADRHRLSRWLAWWCVAAMGRGGQVLGRIDRLDPMLGASTEAALSMLPVGIDTRVFRHHRKSA
jgi:hypothetical protein